MKHSDFKIGLEFHCGERKWKVTDIGSRTIIAICVSDINESWLKGPPYAVPEVVFDENDLEGCEL